MVYGHIWRIVKFAILALNCRFGPEKLVPAPDSLWQHEYSFILHFLSPEMAEKHAEVQKKIKEEKYRVDV